MIQIAQRAVMIKAQEENLYSYAEESAKKIIAEKIGSIAPDFTIEFVTTEGTYEIPEEVDVSEFNKCVIASSYSVDNEVTMNIAVND